MTDEKTDPAAAAPADAIGEVRDLLFGADKRAADDRIAQFDAKLAQIDARLAQLDARQAQLDSRQAQLDLQQGRLDARQEQLDARINRFAQVDGRFAQVVNQLSQYEKWIEQLDSRLGMGLGALIQEKGARENRFKKLEDVLTEIRAEMAADKRAAESRFSATLEQTRAAQDRLDAIDAAMAEARVDAAGRVERLEAGVEELKRGRGLGEAINFSLRNFSTLSRSR